jgi:hypothetical protein
LQHHAVPRGIRRPNVLSAECHAIASAEETQTVWALEAAFLLKSVEMLRRLPPSSCS